MVQPHLIHKSPSKARRRATDKPIQTLCLSYLLVTKVWRLLVRFSNMRLLTKIVVAKIRRLSARQHHLPSQFISLRLLSYTNHVQPGPVPRSTCSSCNPSKTARKRGQYPLYNPFRSTQKCLKSHNKQIFLLEQKWRLSTNTNSWLNFHTICRPSSIRIRRHTPITKCTLAVTWPTI